MRTTWAPSPTPARTAVRKPTPPPVMRLRPPRSRPERLSPRRLRRHRPRKSVEARRAWCLVVLTDLGRQVLIPGHELAPPRLAVDALSPGDVRGEILGMDLPPGAIGSDPV